MKSDKDNRTAQFMPFDALKNLRKKLKEAEEEVENNFEIDLLEDEEIKINEILLSLKKNDKVYIEYVLDKRKNIIYGYVEKIDYNVKYIKINSEKINFNFIYKIKICN